MVLSFLQNCINIMPTEVAKNWLKMGQFFEFWRDFSFSGETQVAYLYKKEFIAVLIDFYLEKKSPVPHLSDKKHSIGNRYTDPEFSPLIQCISNLVRRARTTSRNFPPTSLGLYNFTLYELSENDQNCLFCQDFYEKTLSEKYDPQAFGMITQHYAFENEFFSEKLAQILLKGLKKASQDEAKSYLEAIGYFLCLQDQYQIKRIEWILGYPQPIIVSTKIGCDSFGIYGNTDLADPVITYESTLNVEGGQSMINYMLHNRKRLENLALIILRQLLVLIDQNPAIFEYVFALPSPTFQYAKFIDWIPSFIDYYLAETRRFFYSQSKEEAGHEVLRMYKALEEKFNKKIDQNHAAMIEMGLRTEADVQEEEKDGQNKVLKSFLKPYIIGQTFKEDPISRKPYTNSNDSNQISLIELESYCYIMKSKPTGTTNLSLPQSLMVDGRLKNTDVPNDSPVAFFIQPKVSSYARFHNHSSQESHPVHPKQAEIEEALLKQKTGQGEAEL